MVTLHLDGETDSSFATWILIAWCTTSILMISMQIAPDIDGWFDTSNYNPGSRPLLTGRNKKVVGLMKDEMGGGIMTHFVVLRSKTYSYCLLNRSEGKRCKGVWRCVVRDAMTYEDYEPSLLEGVEIYRCQLVFRSTRHSVSTFELCKLALSRDDDKQISSDWISTLDGGHHRTVYSPIYGDMVLQ